ncbi:MAG: hypothetical protein UY21_C0009G0070 [Microgenomates group bacterium GW2011_GWA1_48_10]|nr:MAG: hypothetical protein UY21_C0009G0070 [Microgenomates group bacterium GW2011_GWA1_48_10]
MIVSGCWQAPLAPIPCRYGKDLREKVISHFDKHPLWARKKKDYKLWREAVLILEVARHRKTSLFAGQGLTLEEEQRLYAIKDEMAQRLSNRKKQDYELRRLKKTGKEVRDV